MMAKKVGSFLPVAVARWRCYAYGHRPAVRFTRLLYYSYAERRRRQGVRSVVPLAARHYAHARRPVSVVSQPHASAELRLEADTQLRVNTTEHSATRTSCGSTLHGRTRAHNHEVVSATVTQEVLYGASTHERVQIAQERALRRRRRAPENRRRAAHAPTQRARTHARGGAVGSRSRHDREYAVPAEAQRERGRERERERERESKATAASHCRLTAHRASPSPRLPPLRRGSCACAVSRHPRRRRTRVASAARRAARQQMVPPLPPPPPPPR